MKIQVNQKNQKKKLLFSKENKTLTLKKANHSQKIDFNLVNYQCFCPENNLNANKNPIKLKKIQRLEKVIMIAIVK